jgi:hypothetical protein
MARPRKNVVEDAAKRADELIAIQAAARTGDDEPAPDDDPPVDELANLEDEGSDGQDGFDMSGLDDEPAPDLTQNKDLEHKFSVLQGKYNAETSRLSSLLSTTMTELQDLKARVNGPRTPELANLSDDNASIESFQEEFPGLYKSVLALARNEAKREVTNATKGTTEKVNAIVQQGEMDKKNVYYSRLAETLPSWEQINSHPAFLKWLNESDEFSGTSRRNLIGAAFSRNDAATTLKFFNAFIKEKGIRVKGRPNDSDDIAPDTSGASVNRNSRGTGGEITRAQMQKFYQDKAQGKLSGTQAEIDKMEARFFQAVREGKVKP